MSFGAAPDMSKQPNVGTQVQYSYGPPQSV